MPDFCTVESNQYYQPQCHGCGAIGSLFRQLHKAPPSTGDLIVGPVLIHQSFTELERCARKCIACQVFRRALLLEQIIVDECEQLRRQHNPVVVVLRRTSQDLNLLISLRAEEKTSGKSAVIRCSQSEDSHLSKGIPGHADWTQLRGWLSACDSKHTCRNYRWSNRNPSWLVKILPNDSIQLVKGPDELVRYVALSYCWGNERTITEKDPEGWTRVKRAHTQVRAKGLPVIERLQPFSKRVYPETLCDAISITEHLGVQYIWIDSVCIPEQDDWDVEASKMHEVYGNAALTLFAASADKAIDPLCTNREAWEHPVKRCRLYGHWISSCDVPLSEIRLRNPLSRRGWILQEERLSPRILYWCAQRAYWSCCERDAVESRQTSRAVDIGAPLSRPQEFMMLTRRGDSEQLEEEWLGMISSYTRRLLADQGKEKDRFRAISGLAVRYLSAGNSDAPQRNEYLAGLWRHGFARHLTWRVAQAVEPERNLRTIAPTWSWASLPLCTDVNLGHAFENTLHFALVDASHVKVSDTPKDVVTKGATVRSVRVRGRLRRFIGQESVIVPWDAVMTWIGDRELFSMALNPNQSIHSRNSDGRVLVYEAHKDEVVGQLDYLDSSGESEKESVSLGENAEVSIHCLEVGKSAMLLLEQHSPDESRHRRVGVSIGYRKNFFDGHEVVTVCLD